MVLLVVHHGSDGCRKHSSGHMLGLQQTMMVAENSIRHTLQ